MIDPRISSNSAMPLNLSVLVYKLEEHIVDGSSM